MNPVKKTVYTVRKTAYPVGKTGYTVKETGEEEPLSRSIEGEPVKKTAAVLKILRGSGLLDTERLDSCPR